MFNYISNINNEVINKSDNLNENPYIIDENGQKKEIVDKMTTLIKYINSYQILHLEQIKQLKDLLMVSLTVL